MVVMRHPLLLSFVALGVFVAARPLSAQDAAVQRGKYLAEQVARCQECHTPKTAAGDFDTSKWMKGSQLQIAPKDQIQGWHAAAPNITSTSALFQRWGDEGLVKFLETAANPRGGKAGPPMPAYTLSHDDAVAIVAYLKSLK
jgi:mono/diheme cytochrome c family protein